MLDIKQAENKPFNELVDNLKDLLPKEDLELLKETYAAFKNTGKQKAKLLRNIVPIETWINSEYYLGNDVHNIYPFWKNEVIKIFNSKERINQVVLTGGIGIGKTTGASLIILRVLYELSCYEHIAALFNLMGASTVAFAYLSVTRQQAQTTGFSLLSQWIDSIPYFKEKFKRKSNLDSQLVWPEERLLVTFGSVANHFIGMNLFGSILDEANFFEGRDVEEASFKMNNKVSDLYSQIRVRSSSRFIINGINYSMSILVSSTTVASSFTEEIIEKSAEDPHTYVVSAPIWVVKPKEFSTKTFRVYAGGNNIDPVVLDSLEVINSILASKNKEEVFGMSLDKAYSLLPDDIKANVINVPIDFLSDFKSNITIALQDLAGYSVSSANKLFTSNISYDRCLDKSLVHPFSREQIVLSTAKDDLHEGFLPLKSWLNTDYTFKDREKPHYIHLDLALTGDDAGMAMTHQSGGKTIYTQEEDIAEEDTYDTFGLGELIRTPVLKNRVTKKIKDETLVPVITVDFMLRINPPKKPNKIALGKIRDFLVFLRDAMHVNIALVTADQFQSAQLLQELSDLGFNTGYLSVDRTVEPYLTLTNLFYEDRIKLYDYAPFKSELFNLIYYPAKKKVDHPSKAKGGKKDVSDAVAGAVYSAVKAKDKSNITQSDLLGIMIDANQEKTLEQRMEDKVNQMLGAMHIINHK